MEIIQRYSDFLVHFVCILLTYSRPTGVYGDLLQVPQDTIITLGDSTELVCTTSFPNYPVDWYYIPTGSADVQNLFSSGHLTVSYSERFSVRKDVSGQYNLVIRNVQMSDAGRYTCADEAGLGVTVSAELSVIDRPVCTNNLHTFADGVIGESLCGFTADIVQYTCRLNFTGHFAPLIKCNTLNDVRVTSRVNSDEVLTKIFISTDIIEHIDSYLTCEIISPMSSGSPDLQHITLHTIQLNLDTVELIKGNVSPTQLNTCGPVNTTCSIALSSNQTCSYYWRNGHDEIILSSQQLYIENLEPSSTYTCTAECIVRGRTCHMRLDVVECNENAHQKSAKNVEAIIIIVTTVSVSALVAVAIMLYCLINAKKRRERKPLQIATIERPKFDPRTPFLTIQDDVSRKDEIHFSIDNATPPENENVTPAEPEDFINKISTKLTVKSATPMLSQNSYSTENVDNLFDDNVS